MRLVHPPLASVCALCGTVALHAVAMLSLGRIDSDAVGGTRSESSQVLAVRLVQPSAPVTLACPAGDDCPKAAVSKDALSDEATQYEAVQNEAAQIESSRDESPRDGASHEEVSASPPPPSRPASDAFTGDASSPLLATRHYYSRKELTDPARPLTEPHIRLPQNDELRFVGRVRLRLYVSEAGKVEDITLLAATLPQEYVENVLQAYREVRFAAGRITGLPVRSWLDVEVDFANDAPPLAL